LAVGDRVRVSDEFSIDGDPAARDRGPDLRMGGGDRLTQQRDSGRLGQIDLDLLQKNA
jgi:hypothetical protein